VYVQRAVCDDFVAKLLAYMASKYRLGQEVGAVVQLPHYQKIRRYVVQAREEGATFRLGGIPDEAPMGGYWVEPTILTEVATSSSVMRVEIFGPVVTIVPFGSEEEAVSLANDNPNGLAAVLLTQNLGRMRRVGEQIEAGLVWVNCWLVRQLATPFGV
jgi:aminomuconate-semialdehyde dehydrogenase